MAWARTDPHWPSAYAEQLKAVHAYGVRREARGTVSYELRPTMVTVQDTSARFLVMPGRGLNHCFALAEAVSIICSVNRVDYLSFYNSGVKKFAKGNSFEGHYGERLRYYDQISYVINTLKADPGSRRAMITIWNPQKDAFAGRLDYPCNIAVMFKRSDNQLHAHVIRRSSDMLWGVPYDHVVFTLLQSTIARSLGCIPGCMTETTDSLHVYHGLYDDTLAAALEATNSGRIWAIPNGQPTADFNDTLQICHEIMSADQSFRSFPPTMWARARHLQEDIRSADPWWSDAWMLMAAYHFWKQKDYDTFIRALDRLSLTFKSAAYSTFEVRVRKQPERFQQMFHDVTLIDGLTAEDFVMSRRGRPR